MNKKDFATLGSVIAAMAVEATPYLMATPAAIKGLAKEEMVETNEAIKDGDKVAVRANDKGTAFYADEANKAKFEAPSAPRVAPELTYGTGFVVPAGVAAGRKPDLYKFDDLSIGGFIFVAKTEAKPEPAKSLASTVSAATKRYAIEVPGKTRVGRTGKTVPLTVNTRVFAIVPVKEGVDYGTFKAPSDGAAIVRLPDHVPTADEQAATAPAATA